MKSLRIVLAACAALAVAAGPALAQPRHDTDHRDAGPPGGDHRDVGRPGPPHHDWRQGGHIASEDWRRGQKVDWRGRHLRRPPHGYEWREVDGNYVLAAAATGLIASLILSR